MKPAATKPIARTEVLDKLNDLPSLPVIVMELIASFEQPDINVRALADKLAHDQALAAKTLRLANSSFYGLARKVDTIQQAVNVLGFDSVRSLVTAAGVVDHFARYKHAHFDFRHFWRHSIATALCAQQLARQRKLNGDYAFVAGLLHDIGRLVLVTRFPEQYTAALALRGQRDCTLLEAENVVLGLDHAIAGQMLAEHWRFPPAMQRVIAVHHAPEKQDLGGMPSVVHVADAIAHSLDFNDGEHDYVPPLSREAWASLGLNRSAVFPLLRATEDAFEQTCQVLAA